ncbi:MAG TPA: caspase family protein [Pyrinomonadaceae bacterium]|nr:caspase family protein [Pyrinomonadaceae bacterium]
MKIGISVNVGLNNVKSTVFQAPALVGCEEDATDMFNLAKDRGFDTTRSQLLIGEAATFEAVKDAVSSAAEVLNSGDLFFFSFAGHGTFKILNTATEEPDKHDESIVLSDHFMIDNFWRRKLWPKFKEGVRIIAVADCCHSETALFDLASASSAPAAGFSAAVVGVGALSGAVGVAERVQRQPPAGRVELPKPGFRMITSAERQKELNQFPEFYNGQAAASPQEIKATRLFLSACKDDQNAADGDPNGAFTAALLNVWNNGSFSGDYNVLMANIGAGFNGTNQTPVLTQIGAPDFSSEQAFKIE